MLIKRLLCLYEVDTSNFYVNDNSLVYCCTPSKFQKVPVVSVVVKRRKVVSRCKKSSITNPLPVPSYVVKESKLYLGYVYKKQ